MDQKKENSPVIRFEKVYKNFGELSVLAGLDLHVLPGESLVVMGPSGTGKSVLLKHIIGLLRPDAGTVWTLGENINTADPWKLQEIRKKTAYVFQLSALFDSMSVADNVALGLTMHSKLKKPEIRDRVKDSLDKVGLSEIENRKVEELSGGMKKRVAIARAIALQPQILLYDEPTTGLDPATCRIVNKMIRDLNDQLQITSVVVTHDIQSATEVADRIALFNHGKIISEGKPDELHREGILHRFIQGEKI